MRLGSKLALALFGFAFALEMATSQAVQTDQGDISGAKESDSDVVVYKGVPFALRRLASCAGAHRALRCPDMRSARPLSSVPAAFRSKPGTPAMDETIRGPERDQRGLPLPEHMDAEAEGRCEFTGDCIHA